MPERIQQQRTTDQAAETEERTEGSSSERAARLRDDLDSLLDEIDGVLEENAEEFVKNYVQKGGE